MKKRTLQITATAFFVSIGVLADQPDNQAAAVQWQFDGAFGGIFGTNPNSFSDIPPAFRTVPWHPDDNTCQCHPPELIPFDSAGTPSIIAIDFQAKTGFTIKNRFTLRGGISYIPIVYYGYLNRSNDGIIREVNIFSGTFERGYGTSLVYYAVRNAGATPALAPIAEVEVRLAEGVHAILGGSRHTYHYDIEQGYDRYDAFQSLDHIPFATMQVYSPYIGIRAGMDENGSQFGWYLTVGPSILQPIQLTPAANGTAIHHGSVGISFTIGLYGNHAFGFGKHK